MLKIKNENGVSCWKFSDCANDKPSPVFTFKAGKENYTRYNGLLSTLMCSGGIKSGGWFYDFRPVLKKYKFKQYDFWHEVYAPNKTLLRKAIYGRIDKITELKG